MRKCMKWVFRILLYPLLIPIPLIILYAVLVERVFALVDDEWDFL